MGETMRLLSGAKLKNQTLKNQNSITYVPPGRPPGDSRNPPLDRADPSGTPSPGDPACVLFEVIFDAPLYITAQAQRVGREDGKEDSSQELHGADGASHSCA